MCDLRKFLQNKTYKSCIISFSVKTAFRRKRKNILRKLEFQSGLYHWHGQIQSISISKYIFGKGKRKVTLTVRKVFFFINLVLSLCYLYWPSSAPPPSKSPKFDPDKIKRRLCIIIVRVGIDTRLLDCPDLVRSISIGLHGKYIIAPKIWQPDDPTTVRPILTCPVQS